MLNKDASSELNRARELLSLTTELRCDDDINRRQLRPGLVGMDMVLFLTPRPREKFK
jgi:hypothetical protein